ncbi:FAD-dependent oxidoreductase [Nonomuraea zeae]|uniref:FAD-dependent monooxygenase n=1 Tax=Nonomuraea zeae TaxID=1642303 RepID=A0A5S4GUW8_9ACTN|nr:FAD-dependent monooxygenase [Nonomuraea zeae]TMR36733.1 FAD-dependent monooxygenase [Nonomuraea zeae]
MGLSVIIAGAGIGGLSLAQGLRKRGVGVTVFERDNDLGPWWQGFRLRIDRHGRGALASCLPADLYDLTQATANKLYTPRGVTYDYLLNETASVRPAGVPLDPAAAATVADRRTLREILFTGLGDAVRFGEPVVGYEHVGDQVQVELADGGTATADVLVAADGVESAVRRRRLPDAELLDLGTRAIYGHMLLTEEVLEWLPPGLIGGARPVLGPESRTLVVGSFQPQMPAAEAVAQFAPHAALQSVPDYLKWTLVVPAASRVAPRNGDPEKLHATALKLLDGWHPVLRRVVAESRVEATFALSIRAMSPTPEWPSDNVTVLGDCIHAMTPVGGFGANTALRDAAALAAALAEADAGRRELVEAINRYENEMRDYAYEAISRSLWGAELMFRIPSRSDPEGARA